MVMVPIAGSWRWVATCWWPSLPWRGSTFEDAILVSERLVKEDYYTSIHIEGVGNRERATQNLDRKRSRATCTDVRRDMLRDLDDSGIIPSARKLNAGFDSRRQVSPKRELSNCSKKNCCVRSYGEKAGGR